MMIKSRIKFVSLCVIVVIGAFYSLHTTHSEYNPKDKETISSLSLLEGDKKRQDFVGESNVLNEETPTIVEQNDKPADRPAIRNKHIMGSKDPPVGDHLVEHHSAPTTNQTVERQSAPVNDKQTKTTHGAPALHVALLKVHKCGSSSVQNVFLRIGEANNATFVLGKVGSGPHGCDKAPHCISYTESLTEHNTVPPPPGKHFDILCCDVRYHRQQWRKYLPNDTVNIGLVRDPVRRLESAISFYKGLRHINMSSFAKKPNYRNLQLNNRIAFEFGFRQEWLPKRQDDETARSSAVHVDRYMNDTMPDFDIIMVNERLDESFVLLKRRLRWRTQDVVYAKKNVNHHNSLSGLELERMKKFLYLDYIVYHYAVQKLDRMISEAGSDFLDEVKDFQEVTQTVNDFCTCNIENNSVTFTVRETEWHEEFIVTKSYCESLLRDEIEYVNRLRIKQYGSFRKT